MGRGGSFPKGGKIRPEPEAEPEEAQCIIDEDRVCPPSRYDCARPCPYTGWEKRTKEKEA